jgi:hypothetical protein
MTNDTMRVTTISERKPHTFGDNHRNAGYQQGDEIASWYDGERGGWFAVVQGIGPGGNWYESDDFGPFPAREAAEAEARDYYEHYGEE